MIKLLALLTLASANLINCYTKHPSQHVPPNPTYYPLHYASFFGLHTIISTIARHPGCNINAIDLFGRTPLHCAAAQGHNNSIATLLRYGANIDSREMSGLLPEDLARINCHARSYSFLITYRSLDLE